MLKLAKIDHFRSSNEDKFLDQQPIFHRIIKNFVESIELEDELGTERFEEIECRSRDGFFRASHNFGGFDKYAYTLLSYADGSCDYNNVPGLQETADQYYKDAAESFYLENKENLPGIDLDKVTYHDLYEMGKGELAEQLSEYTHEWMDTPVWFGVRAMYEGFDETGLHTLMIYVGHNICDYHGPFQKGSTTALTLKINFRSVMGLKRQLGSVKRKLEKAI